MDHVCEAYYSFRQVIGTRLIVVILDNIRLFETLFINPFQSNFSANRLLPSSYLLWVGKRLVDYLLAKVCTTRGKVSDRLLQRSGQTNAKKNCRTGSYSGVGEQTQKKKASDVTRHRSRMGKS